MMKYNYSIKIKRDQINDGVAWCSQNIGTGTMMWGYNDNTFFFDAEEDIMAFKLRFDEVKMVLIIDPPSGWKYGFPKPFTKGDDEELEDWLLRNGYPQSEIDQGGAKYCRYWEHEIE